MSTSADRLRIEARPFEHPDAQALIDKIQQLYVDLYSGRDRDSTDPAEFAPPNGIFLVAYLDGEPVGCGGWRRLSPASVEINSVEINSVEINSVEINSVEINSVEIKRMYVVESARGGGIARSILRELERVAAGAGATRVTLNTGCRQTAAIAFYEATGYQHTDDRFGPYAAIAGARFFEKRLR